MAIKTLRHSRRIFRGHPTLTFSSWRPCGLCTFVMNWWWFGHNDITIPLWFCSGCDLIPGGDWCSWLILVVGGWVFVVSSCLGLILLLHWSYYLLFLLLRCCSRCCWLGKVHSVDGWHLGPVDVGLYVWDSFVSATQDPICALDVVQKSIRPPKEPTYCKQNNESEIKLMTI